MAELLVNNMDETETTADIFNEWDINGDNELSFTELKVTLMLWHLLNFKQNLTMLAFNTGRDT